MPVLAASPPPFVVSIGDLLSVLGDLPLTESGVHAQNFLNDLVEERHLPITVGAESLDDGAARPVASWRAEIERLRTKQQELQGLGVWRTGPDDFLGVLRRTRDELTHSRLLGWLLTPTGQHGLGSALVRRFFAYCGVDPDLAVVDAAVVRLEVSRPESEADIVVECPEATVVIENKIDAIEQPNQCARLSYDHPDATWVFLTPKGVGPTSAAPDQRNLWKLLSWPQVAEMLNEALAGGNQSAPGRTVAEQYLGTLRGMHW